MEVAMHHLVIACVLAFATVSGVHAQNPLNDSVPDEEVDQGYLVCKTEKAMMELMKSQPPATTVQNTEVRNRLIKSGACLVTPRGWVVLEVQDPASNQPEDHAAKALIRTPSGIIQMWATPFGE